MSLDVVLPHARTSTPVTPRAAFQTSPAVMLEDRNGCWGRGEGVLDSIRDSDGDLVKVFCFV